MSFLPDSAAADSKINKRVLDLLSRYQARPEWMPDKDSLLSVEADDSEILHPRLKKPIYKTELKNGNSLIGIPDRVSLAAADTLLVEDHKTGFYIPDDPLQMSSYAILASKRFGMPNVRGRFLYPALGFEIPYWFGPEDLAYAETRITDLTTKVEEMKKSGKFPKTLCRRCPICHLRGKCEEYAKVLNGEVAPPPVIPDDIDELSKHRKRLTALRKIYSDAAAEAERKMAEIIGEDGCPSSTGMVWKRRQAAARYDLGAAPLVTLLRRFGLSGRIEEVVVGDHAGMVRLIEGLEKEREMDPKAITELKIAFLQIRTVATYKNTFSLEPGS